MRSMSALSLLYCSCVMGTRSFVMATPFQSPAAGQTLRDRFSPLSGERTPAKHGSGVPSTVEGPPALFDMMHLYCSAATCKGGFSRLWIAAFGLQIERSGPGGPRDTRLSVGDHLQFAICNPQSAIR